MQHSRMPAARRSFPISDEYMKISRRQAVQAGATIFAAIPLTGCESVYSHFAKEWGQKIPEKLGVSQNKNIDPIFHLLSRAAFGPWPGDAQKVKKMGAEKWIDEQLKPESLDDKACDLRAHRFETLYIPAGACYDFKKECLRKDIVRHALLRAVYSKRQLFEVMVGFWTDHLNISLDKGDCVYLKPQDDRLVIRAHALGKFNDLIRTSAKSPAMLVYLDGKENRKTNAGDVPNENYARELLELHTLGVYGGYSQKDVFEVARCLTGWRLHEDWQRAQVYFDASRHDGGEKYVLGQRIAPGGGADDLDKVIDIVCDHPSTAAYIGHKIANKFVNEPSSTLVKHLGEVFTSTGGDISKVVRAVLTSEEFQNDRGSKVKRPFHFIASSLRALGCDTHAHPDLIEYLQRMGHSPFQYPSPDGYPDEANFWMGTLLWRWKFALAVAAGEIKSVLPDLDGLFRALQVNSYSENDLKNLFAHFAGRSPLMEELEPLEDFVRKNKTVMHKRKAELAGLFLCSPAFQRY